VERCARNDRRAGIAVVGALAGQADVVGLQVIELEVLSLDRAL
jgi:hypothetical protein